MLVATLELLMQLLVKPLPSYPVISAVGVIDTLLSWFNCSVDDQYTVMF